MNRPNFYDQSGLDRMSERRADSDWIAKLLSDGETRIMPVWRARNFVVTGDAPQAAHLAAKDALALIDDGNGPVFLGLKEGIAHFSVDLSHIEDPAGIPALSVRGEFVELRDIGALLSRDEGSILAYARALAHWHRHHRFCGKCGAPTEMRESGHLRTCTDSACAAPHFPRTDPAVIMLVSRGDRVLLGRKREWVEGMYSALAGFVEPGESLEAAVAREVMEETAVAISNVRYQSSQPWPFPASLMLGFYADAESEEIEFDTNELEDARWFTRAELAAGGAGLANRRRSDSIARRLMTEWIGQG
ncbi:MAG: NAD(+) diphosphatase [Alphaproteobacteria bacterium]